MPGQRTALPLAGRRSSPGGPPKAAAQTGMAVSRCAAVRPRQNGRIAEELYISLRHVGAHKPQPKPLRRPRKPAKEVKKRRSAGNGGRSQAAGTHSSCLGQFPPPGCRPCLLTTGANSKSAVPTTFGKHSVAWFDAVGLGLGPVQAQPLSIWQEVRLRTCTSAPIAQMSHLCKCANGPFKRWNLRQHANMSNQ